MMPPMKPAPMSTATAPTVKSGGDSGPVGDCIGDVAGQCGDEEAHRQVADLEGDGPQVGTDRSQRQVAEFGGQIPQGVAQDDVLGVVGNVESAEEEAQSHEQTAGGDEGDHIADAGQQHPLEVGTDAFP